MAGTGAARILVEEARSPGGPVQAAVLDRLADITRLDALTSGLLLVARSHSAAIGLGNQFESKLVRKVYQAIAVGKTPEKGLLQYPIDGQEAYTEFRLLRYFMLHPGKLLSKSRLAEHVYAEEAETDSNVLEVYVNRLRRKLGRERIATRRGQGYVFGTDP